MPKEANINVEAGEAFVQLWRKISDGLGEELADRLDDTARFISGLPSSVPFASRRSIFHAHCRDSSPPNRASSFSITCASYALMLGIMVLSVVYDQEFEPIITFAFDAGRSITNWLDSLVSGTYWGQIAVNHLRERVNMTHVVLPSQPL